MNTCIKLICLSILVIVPVHAMQNDAELGELLIKAARAGDHKKIEQLITAGAPVDYAVEGSCITALIAAANNGHPDCVQALIAAGAQVNLPGYNGITALMYAALNNNFKCAQALIAAGARVNHTTNYGVNALSNAAARQSQPICELLVEKMLWIPNQDQKAKIITFLGITKFRKSLYLPRLDANLRNELKEPCPAAIYEDNKKNFANSVAFQEIATLKARDTSDIKKALLEKYNANAPTSNSQTGV